MLLDAPGNAAQLMETNHQEMTVVLETLKSGNRQLAWTQILRILTRLSMQNMDQETEALYTACCLEFANLCFILGQGFEDAMVFLQLAKKAAENAGNRRSAALINLHLARLYYFAERRHEAMDLFVLGETEVEELADDDIMDQAAEFIGLYYFIQGLLDRAQPYFERAARCFESYHEGTYNMSPSGPMWLSYCAAYRGQYHRAIGALDYYRRLAIERSDRAIATTLRAVLGIVLLEIKKMSEAAFHLSGALQEAIKTKNSLARYFAKGGLAYLHLAEGRPSEAHKWITEAVKEGASSGLIRQYSSPFVLEVLFELHQRGMEPIPQMNYHREFQRIMMEPNILLRGVAMRLRALDTVAGARDPMVAESDLKLSEEYLKHSGARTQLAKTRLEMARLKLRENDIKGAQLLARKAQRDLSGYLDVFLPDDMRHLLSVKSDFLPDHGSQEELFDMFVNMIEELKPSADLNKLLVRTVSATNRFFAAERGGIFWFNQGRSTKKYELRAAINLSSADVESEVFRSSLSLIFNTYREKKPQVARFENSGFGANRIKAALCVPFEGGGQTVGVIYHDSSYLNDCFDHFTTYQLLRISKALTSYVEQILRFGQNLEHKAAVGLNHWHGSDDPEIFTHDPAMLKLLQQVDRIAKSETTVLILGETGVGKELLARRLHKMSPRHKEPLVVVDSTTIPENLFESELFGHEKGAFTGADRQKPGRIELAHRGTLFIDEVGEIPRSSQVKLLRAIQEKTLVRVGGTQTLRSDFRLVAATNRDLAAEVVAGRFREDLYYRLNVIPITMPPLRERKSDIVLLAGFYLDLYSTKYDRTDARLTPEDEAMLTAYDWPGNIRELKNVIERAVLMSTGARLDLHLPIGGKIRADTLFAGLPSLEEMQRRYIEFILEKTEGRIGGSGGAAEMLGMKRTSLNSRMKKLGMRSAI